MNLQDYPMEIQFISVPEKKLHITLQKLGGNAPPLNPRMLHILNIINTVKNFQSFNLFEKKKCVMSFYHIYKLVLKKKLLIIERF